MIEKRMKELQKAIPEGMDAVLITSHINRRYFTGFPSSAGTVLVTKDKCYLIIDTRYVEAAKGAVKHCTVILQDKLYEQLGELIKKHKVKNLGIESKTMTVSELEALKEKLSKVEIVTGNSVSEQMEKQRAIKSAAEIEDIRAAQKIADEGFLHILNYVQAGRTENEIAVELEQYCRRAGSEEVAFSFIIAAGTNTSKPHAVPGENKVRIGDFITMDFGCTVNGYRSDMTRTIAVGSVCAHQKALYETVLSSQLAGIAKIKNGAACSKVDKAARDIIDASEFKGYFGHGLGHSLGLEIHEEPRCNTLSKDKLLTGMVTSVEPGIYIPGKYGARIEDIVVVTSKGCENLCTSIKELLVL